MDNKNINEFFEKNGLLSSVQNDVSPPSSRWIFQAAGFPILIQTQEDVDRLRIVAFISDASNVSNDELNELMNANYHSAMDARYALTDDKLVSVFLHPLAELTEEQFSQGLYQVINCAETCGTTNSGGTLIFGPSRRTAPQDTVKELIQVIGSPQARHKIFISYSHKDEEWLKHLLTMMHPLIRQKAISVWYDKAIKPSEKWRAEIRKSLESASVAVLMVSPEFLNSDFINLNELPYLLDAATKRRIKLTWIHVKHAMFEETEIEQFQALHDVAKPLYSLVEAELGAVLKNICIQIKGLVS